MDLTTTINMAFSPQELEIIRSGVSTGKSKDQIVGALSNFRMGSVQHTAPVAANPITAPWYPTSVTETSKDFSQMLSQSGEAGLDRYNKAMDVIENPEFSTSQKIGATAGQVAGFGSDIIGNIFKGIVKMGMSQEAERSVVNYIGQKGTEISQTEAAQGMKQWYDNLKPDDKLIVDEAGNIGMFMVDVLTLGSGKAVTSTTRRTLEETVAQGRRGLEGIRRPPVPPVPPPSTVLEKAGTAITRTTDAVGDVGAKATSNVVEQTPTLVSAAKQTTGDLLSRIPRAITHGTEAVADKAAEAEKMATLAAETPKAAEALRVGVSEPVINSVLASDRTTLQSLLKMVDIAEKAPSTLGQKELPAIVSGDAAVEMFKFVEADRRAVGEAIGKATEELAKQQKVIDMKPVYREVASVLKANDIIPDLKGNLRFKNLSLTDPEKAAIQKLYTAATSNKALSPTQIHQMDRLFSKLERESRLVDKIDTIYVKGADGQPQNIFRVFRDVFSKRLEELSPEIKRLNTAYREAKNLVDDLRNTILKTGDYTSLKGVDSAEWVANNLRRILGNAQSSPAYAAIYNKLDETARRLGYTGARADLLQAFAVELEKVYPDTVKPTSFKGNINASIPATKAGVIERVVNKVLETGAPSSRDQQKALRALIEDRLNYGFKPETTPTVPTESIPTKEVSSKSLKNDTTKTDWKNNKNRGMVNFGAMADDITQAFKNLVNWEGKPKPIGEVEDVKKLVDSWNSSTKVMNKETGDVLTKQGLGGGSDLTFEARTAAKELGFELEQNPQLILAVSEEQRPLLMAFLEQNNSDALKSVDDFLAQNDNVLEEAMKVDTYPAPRSEVHKKIIKDIHKSGSWTGKGENGEDLFGGKVNQDKRLDIVIGAPAAGKSEVLANPLSKKHGSLLVDADRVKAAMPEYNGFNAAELHQESSDVVEGALLTYAFKKGDNIVLPIVGKSQSTIEKVAKLAKDAGYEVHLTLNQVPPEVAVARAEARAAKSGRVVPKDYILNSVGNKPLQNFNEFKLRSDLFDSATAFSNDVKKGKSLDLMESDTVSYGFASPSVKVGMQYDDAFEALKTPEHMEAYKKFQDIDREVGIPVATHSAIGKWADGAENTLYYKDGDITKEDLIYAMAKKGRGDGTAENAQKQVIWFKQAEGGQDFVHDVSFKGVDPKEISSAMDELGIPYQTVSNDRVIMFNKSGDYFDTEMLDKLVKLKEKFGDKITDIKNTQGEGDFIGSWLDGDIEARQEALKVYDDIIKAYESKQ